MVRYMKQLLSIFCLLILVSCSNEVSNDKLVERQGITYEVNSQTPFTGSEVSYYENGKLERRGNLKEGEQDGMWETFEEEGNLTKTEEWKDGELVE